MSDSQTLDRIAELLSRATGLEGLEIVNEIADLVRESGREVGMRESTCDATSWLEPATTCPVCHEGNVEADVTVTVEKGGQQWIGRSVWESVDYSCGKCEAEYDDVSPDAEEIPGARSSVLIGMNVGD